jgi:hypothetical protein
MKKYGKIFKILGVLLWIAIISQLDLHRVVLALRNIDYRWIGAAFVSFLSMSIFKGLRWRIVVRAQGSDFPIPMLIRITLVSSFAGLLTPGRVGDFIRVAYLKEANISVASGITNVFLDRLYDIAMLLVFGSLGLALFSTLLTAQAEILLIALTVAVAVFTALFALRGKVSSIAKKVLRVLLQAEQYDAIATKWREFWSELGRLAARTYPTMLVFSVLIYALYFFQVFALAKSLGIAVPFFFLAMSSAVAALVSLLPISVGGLGTREATLILLLGKVSVPPESAVLLSFVDNFIFGMLLGGAIASTVWLFTGRRSDAL